MFDTNCLLGYRLFFARLDRIVWEEKCFYMHNILFLVIKKSQESFSLMSLATRAESHHGARRLWGESFAEAVVCLQCSAAEYGTLNLVGVQRQALSFQLDCTLRKLPAHP